MARPCNKLPNRKDGRFEYKGVIGRDKNGRQKRKSFYSAKSFKDAKIKYEEYKAEQLKNEIEGKPTPMDFETFAVKWLTTYKKGKVKDSTYKSSYQLPTMQYLVPHFKGYKICNITEMDIADFFNDLSNNYSTSTLRKTKICLNSIFKKAVVNGYAKFNPIEDYKLQSEEFTVKDTYNEEQRNAIINFAKTEKNGMYIWILLELALRCSELCGLKVSDFDFNRQTVSIQRAVTEVNGKPFVDKTKNKSSQRTLPISTELCDFLKIKLNNKGQDDYILTTSNGNIMDCSYFTKNIYNKFFENLYNQLGIPRYSPHCLRHTCGTLLYEKTKDIYAVSKFMGHSNITTTAKIYVHDSAEMLRKSLNIV